MVGVDEKGGGVRAGNPFLEFVRAHDCYYAVLILPWKCPDGSEFSLHVLFEYGVFVVELGQEILLEMSTLWKMGLLAG